MREGDVNAQDAVILYLCRGFPRSGPTEVGRLGVAIGAGYFGCGLLVSFGWTELIGPDWLHGMVAFAVAWTAAIGFSSDRIADRPHGTSDHGPTPPLPRRSTIT